MRRPLVHPASPSHHEPIPVDPLHFMHRRAIDIQVNDRRDLGRLKRRFDRLAIAHDDDGQMIQVDVLLRDAQDVVFRDRRDRLRVLLVVVVGQRSAPTEP